MSGSYEKTQLHRSSIGLELASDSDEVCQKVVDKQVLHKARNPKPQT